ncbi:MAG: VOC family protein [Alphaproteobacteria bacterium]|jgi:predicted 3-demethylubiquinone-9 3-methyltransferase (glyoxalase superfamily)|nr:VOC family protein [Alphaproteobacteria bacterium]
MSKQKIYPFLTFNGKAETAMNFYAESIPNTKIVKCLPYGEHPMAVSDDDKKRIMFGMIEIANSTIMFLDMTEAHPAPEFNWANSLCIEAKDEAEFDAIFKTLSEGGKVMMGPEAVGPLRKCAWVVDKFGVVWQPIWE